MKIGPSLIQICMAIFDFRMLILAIEQDTKTKRLNITTIKIEQQ